MQKTYYRVVANEQELFLKSAEIGLPILLKGPTGCGKSRFVEAMARHLNRPLISIACNEDTSATDLLGRFLLKGGETAWQDGPVTRAVRTGALLYLDEIAEAREDVVVVLHSLSDHRRQIHIDRLNETVNAAPGFQMVVSFNPGYQSGLKDLKPSTRQRFVTVAFNYPPKDIEEEIVSHESGVDEKTARKLVELAQQVRSLQELNLTETVSTRLLVHSGKLIASGVSPRLACDAAIAQTLSDDADICSALRDLIHLRF